MLRMLKPKISMAACQYDTAFTAAMQPELYGHDRIADTFDGRFDSLILHLFPFFHELKNNQAAQELYDVLFQRLELSLREQGVGDMGIQPRMRKMMQAFNGRIASYENAAKSNDKNVWRDALQRNVFRGFANDATLDYFVDYAQKLLR